MHQPITQSSERVGYFSGVGHQHIWRWILRAEPASLRELGFQWADKLSYFMTWSCHWNPGHLIEISDMWFCQSSDAFLSKCLALITTLTHCQSWRQASLPWLGKLMNRQQLKQLNPSTPDFSVRQKSCLEFLLTMQESCHLGTVELLRWIATVYRKEQGHSSCAGRAVLGTSSPGLGQPKRCFPKQASARWLTAAGMCWLFWGPRLLTCFKKSSATSQFPCPGAFLFKNPRHFFSSLASLRAPQDVDKTKAKWPMWE